MSGLDFFIFELIFIVIGIFAGLMAGILGIGGGIIVVPGLLFFFQLYRLIPEHASMHVAVGTSLAIMVITSQASIRAQYTLGGILWPIFIKLWPGITLGSVCGVVLAQYIPTYWLQILFALFLFIIAGKMFLDRGKEYESFVPKKWVNGLVSYSIGLQSGLLGVGGGVLVVPYLTYCGIDRRKIAAISGLCTLTAGLIGAIVCIITGQKEMAGVPYATGYVYWPAVLGVAIPSCIIAPFGAQLNFMIPVQYLSYIFMIVLCCMGIKMLV